MIWLAEFDGLLADPDQFQAVVVPTRGIILHFISEWISMAPMDFKSSDVLYALDAVLAACEIFPAITERSISLGAADRLPLSFTAFAHILQPNGIPSLSLSVLNVDALIIAQHMVTIDREHCIELRNINAAMAIVYSLGSAALHRLSKTWSRVPRPAKANLAKLRSLLSPSSNFARLRDFLRNLDPPRAASAAAGAGEPEPPAAGAASAPNAFPPPPPTLPASTVPVPAPAPPAPATSAGGGGGSVGSADPRDAHVVPWLGLFVRDVIQVEEALPVFVDVGETLVNVSRCRLLEACAAAALRFQASRATSGGWRTFPRVARLLVAEEGLLRSPTQQFKASLELEPRDAAAFK
ncbi:hypothetical protein HK405_004741 [Cladochytrium tenue]|nr:hypothetical protein HK405_004741 [Cladochytrium tenue]